MGYTRNTTESVSPTSGTSASAGTTSWPGKYQHEEVKQSWSNIPGVPDCQETARSTNTTVNHASEESLRAVIMIMTGYNKNVDDLLRMHFAVNSCSCPKKSVDLSTLQSKVHEHTVSETRSPGIRPEPTRYGSYSSTSSSTSSHDRNGSVSSASSVASSRSASRQPSIAEYHQKALPTVMESPSTSRFNLSDMSQNLPQSPRHASPARQEYNAPAPEYHRRPSEIPPESTYRRPSEAPIDPPSWRRPSETPAPSYYNSQSNESSYERKASIAPSTYSSTAYSTYNQQPEPTSTDKPKATGGRAAFEEAEEKARGYSVFRSRQNSEWGSFSMGSGEHLPSDLASLAGGDRKASVASGHGARKMSHAHGMGQDRKMSTTSALGGGRKMSTALGPRKAHAAIASNSKARRPSDWSGGIGGFA